MKTTTYLHASLASLCAVPIVQGQAKTDQRPNIIMVLVDDLGFTDLGCYGSDIDTPHLDRLASEGIRFRQFYNASISAPTRASVITGQYHHRAGIGYFENCNLGLPGYQGFLNRESLTFAEVLRQAGYSTLHSGKWDVGMDREQWPNQRGFDHSFNFRGGASAYYDVNSEDFGLNGSKKPLEFFKDNEPYLLGKGNYLTDVITDNAIEFIENQDKEFRGSKPFFLFLAFNAPHAPLQAPQDVIAKYHGKLSMGFDSLRQRRYESAQRIGVFPKNNSMTHRDDSLVRWNQLTYDQQQYWQREREVFTAMVDRLDQSIGRLLATLRLLGKDQNTLIVFCSDNGPQGFLQYTGYGPQVYSTRPEGPVGSPYSNETPNSNWSQAGAAPLRNYKRSVYEGGISTPFIAWLPGRVRAGQIVDGIGHIIDLAPTFYELAGAKYPTTYNGVTVNKLSGHSLLPVFEGKIDHVERNEPLFFEREGHRAVREGKWKYIRDTYTHVDELYDIEHDRGENINLASKYPNIVKTLKSKWHEWAQQNEVVEDFSRIKGGRTIWPNPKDYVFDTQY